MTTPTTYKYAFPENITYNGIIEKVVEANKSVVSHNHKVEAAKGVLLIGVISAIAITLFSSPLFGILTFGTAALGTLYWHMSAQKDAADIASYRYIFEHNKSLIYGKICYDSNRYVTIVMPTLDGRHYTKFDVVQN